MEQRSWEANIHSAVKKFFTFYGTHRFITMFSRACQWTLLWVMNPFLILTHYCKIHFNIILLSMSRPQKWSLLFKFSDHNFVCIFHLSHPILLGLITLIIIGKEYKRCSLLCTFLHPPVTSSLVGPNILLSTLFSNTLNLCSSHRVRDQVSHPHRTSKIMVLYTIISTFLDRRQDERFWTEW